MVYKMKLLLTQSHYHVSYFLKLLFIQVFPDSSAGKESTCNAGDPCSIPQLGKSPGEGNGSPFQYSGLENSMDHIVHGVTKSQTRLSDFHFYLFRKQQDS